MFFITCRVSYLMIGKRGKIPAAPPELSCSDDMGAREHRIDSDAIFFWKLAIARAVRTRNKR